MEEGLAPFSPSFLFSIAPLPASKAKNIPVDLKECGKKIFVRAYFFNRIGVIIKNRKK
jgi:hypothetical protein